MELVISVHYRNDCECFYAIWLYRYTLNRGSALHELDAVNYKMARVSGVEIDIKFYHYWYN